MVSLGHIAIGMAGCALFACGSDEGGNGGNGGGAGADGGTPDATGTGTMGATGNTVSGTVTGKSLAPVEGFARKSNLYNLS